VLKGVRQASIDRSANAWLYLGFPSAFCLLPSALLYWRLQTVPAAFRLLRHLTMAWAIARLLPDPHACAPYPDREGKEFSIAILVRFG
jgi:hypothetical protein